MDDRNPMERIRALEQAFGELRGKLDACRADARRTAHDLGERVKELTCLYAISSLMQRSAPEKEVMEGVVNSLVPAYQYPEITGACIRLKGQSFCTPGFHQTPWIQAAALMLEGQPEGAIEVCYGEERPEAAEGPFLSEERHLLDAVAEIVVNHLRRRRVEKELSESEERYRRQAAELEAIYWSAPIGLAVLDTELRFIHVNRRLAEMNGAPAEAHIGRTLHEIAPGVAAMGERLNRRTMETGEPSTNVEFYAKSPAQAGTGRCWNTHWLPLKDDAGKVWGVNVVVEEITERKHFEENLYRREQQFEALAERSPDVIARVDRHGRFLYVNPAAEQMTGQKRGSVIGKRLDELHLAPEEETLRRQAMRQVFARGEEQVQEHIHHTRDGDRHFQSRIVPEFGREGAVESALIVGRDITELKRVQQALEQMTLHDPLTGVANRRYLEQFIQREWRHEARHRHTVAMVMADIDRFKAYNDRYGHPRGDECLRRVAEALRARLRRPTDLLVRYGGEEFVIVLPETGIAEARQMAEAMRRAVEELDVALVKSSDDFPVTISLGVSAAPAHSRGFSDLLASADQALYRAKQRGRNRVEALDS